MTRQSPEGSENIEQLRQRYTALIAAYREFEAKVTRLQELTATEFNRAEALSCGNGQPISGIVKALRAATTDVDSICRRLEPYAPATGTEREGERT